MNCQFCFNPTKISIASNYCEHCKVWFGTWGGEIYDISFTVSRGKRLLVNLDRETTAVRELKFLPSGRFEMIEQWQEIVSVNYIPPGINPDNAPIWYDKLINLTAFS